MSREHLDRLQRPHARARAEIKAFVEAEILKQGGKVYLAIEEAMRHFGLSETAVKNARRAARVRE